MRLLPPYLWSGSLCRSGTPRGRIVASLAAGLVLVLSLVGGNVQTAEPQAPPATSPAEVFAKSVAPILQKHCVACHGEQMQEAGVAFHQFRDFAAVEKERKVWERVARVLQAGVMPPDDSEQRPTPEETKLVQSWIESVLRVDCTKVRDPGRVTIRRLNRNEYNNTIRDLLGVDFQPAKDFPSDDVGYGFDNIGDVLSLPPLLMERYMDAAEEIAARVVAGGDLSGQVQTKSSRELSSKTQKTRDDQGFYNLSSDGNVFADFDFRFAGEYIVTAEAAAQQAGDEPAQMAIRVAERDIRTHNIVGDRTPSNYETRVIVGSGQPIDVGRQRVAAAFVNDYYQPDATKPKAGDRNLLVRTISVRGPLNVKVEIAAGSTGHLTVVKPDARTTVEAAARSTFQPFMTHAFRRPVTDVELNLLVKLVKTTVDAGEPFEFAVQLGVQAVLVSPHFLFRAEFDEQPDNSNASHAIGQYELASRLSYFLWSSMPDDELFGLAASGKLHEPAILEQQVERMLADPKSAALVQNFGAQWLNLGILDQAAPNPKLFPDFDNALRRDMRRETELLFETVMRENRSIFDFLDANFTFVNERLAKHYGISGVTGDEFQRVSLEGTTRRGVLTHASVLTLTSDPGKTKPVKRGKWVLENILGSAPPPPPPNVPALAEVEKAKPQASLREQLAEHRTNARCASCHEVMDPLGLGFENFDAIGKWRDKDGERAIDASGALPNGEQFRDPRELISLIRKRELEYARHFAETMLTFALGRGLEYYDTCTVGSLVDAIAGDGYRFKKLVIEIVKSDAFLQRRGDGGQP